MTATIEAVAKSLDLSERGVVRLLDAAVVERGENFVYNADETGGKCVYVHHGQPACLVGDVLIRAGVPVDWFLGTTASGVPRNTLGASSIIEEVQKDFHVEVPLSARSALINAQSSQDGGDTWGHAVKRALRALSDSILRRS